MTGLKRFFARILSFLVPGWLAAGEPGVEIQVVPPLPLEEGVGVALHLDSGERVELLRGRDGIFKGLLSAEQKRRSFTPCLLPGEHPEAGAMGQGVPPRSAAGLEGAVWLFPASWRGRPNPPGHPYRTGLHEDLVIAGSSRVPGPRTVRVHLPRAYTETGAQRFPVVYLLDGQNVFDASTAYPGVEWNADEVAARHEATGGPPAILVGVDNGMGRRMHEYTFCKDPKHPDGGGAAEHLAFVLDEVVPRIEARYRVQKGRRFLVGSSLGGLFALYAALERPGAFEAVAAMSPSIWWAGGAVLKLEPATGPRTRVWIDMGTKEGGAGALDPAVRRLRELGWGAGHDLGTLLVENGAHHESAWAVRLPRVLGFFLDPRK